jgi:hypothetical protein
LLSENCAALQQNKPLMSEMGLGRVKIHAPAARIEYIGGIAHHENQIMLRSVMKVSRI